MAGCHALAIGTPPAFKHTLVGSLRRLVAFLRLFKLVVLVVLFVRGYDVRIHVEKLLKRVDRRVVRNLLSAFSPSFFSRPAFVLVIPAAAARRVVKTSIAILVV